MYAMTLTEMDRLESNCSAISSVYALLIVHYLSYLSPWLYAIAIPGHPNTCKYSVSNPCLKPPKHESCDMRNAVTNPQSYCGEEDFELHSCSKTFNFQVLESCAWTCFAHTMDG